MRLTEISKTETLRYMGHKGEVPKKLEDIIEESQKTLISTVFPRYTYRVAEIAISENTIKVTDFPRIIESVDLANHLRGCNRAVIMAVTLTNEADKLISRAEVTDIMKAYTLDAMCTTAVEMACDIAEVEIMREIQAKYKTSRYSAGYGDLEIAYQSDFIRYLSTEKRIGLTLTPEYLMIPRKSVTAIFGVSESPLETRKKGCQTCNMRSNCHYRKSGTCCSQSD